MYKGLIIKRFNLTVYTSLNIYDFLHMYSVEIV